MKHLIFMIIIFSANIIFSQTADLILKTHISQDYINYLNDELNSTNQTIANPPSDSDLMKAYAKRMFIDMSLIHCDIDSLVEKQTALADTIRRINVDLDNFYEKNIERLGTEDSKQFFDDLLELFKDPKYQALKSEVDGMVKEYKSAATDMGMNTSDFTKSIADKFEQISNDFEILRKNEIPFNLRIDARDAGIDQYLDFNDSHFRKTDAIFDLCKKTGKTFKIVADQFIFLQHDEIQPAEMIDSLKKALVYFSNGLDSLSSLLENEPFSFMQINTDWIQNTQNFISDFTDLLNGKTYNIGGDNIKIRPVAFLEHSFEEWRTIIMDFYRSSDRYSYTFANLFPDALPASYVDKLKENMILNVNDNDEQMETRMIELRNSYLEKIKNGENNSINNFGAAFTRTYLFILDLNKKIKEFVNYLKKGDFRYGFNFKTINNKSLTDSISENYRIVMNNRDMVFTILTITDSQVQPYTISNSTDLLPMFVTNAMVSNLNEFSLCVLSDISEIRKSIESIHENFNKMFITTLDPNYLDFSNAKSAYDIILVLEKSNPDFLDITSFGIDKMKEFRTSLRENFSRYAGELGNFSNFLNSLVINQNEYQIDRQEFYTTISNINSFLQDVNTDFQYPDSTTMINGIKVNLSAWFDNPPQDLLVKLKWFFDDDSTTDNTLGGLFPDGIATNIVLNNNMIPVSFALSQNYPNPFNPTTKIKYEIPKTSLVTLKVYDVLGREVKTLVDESKAAGSYEVTFKAIDLPSGIYFYRIQAGDYVKVKKMVLLK